MIKKIEWHHKNNHGLDSLETNNFGNAPWILEKGKWWV